MDEWSGFRVCEDTERRTYIPNFPHADKVNLIELSGAGGVVCTMLRQAIQRLERMATGVSDGRPPPRSGYCPGGGAAACRSGGVPLNDG